MATILRFEDDAGVTRLNLNTTTGFELGEGLDLGDDELQTTWLSQPPYPGAAQAATHRPIVVMTIPLLLLPQASFAAMETLKEALDAELDRVTNIIRFQPDGAAAAWLIDTYRAPRPSLYRGQGSIIPSNARLYDPQPITLQIPRFPEMRNAGAFI